MRSEVSRICADLDAEVAAFRDRSPAGMAFRYVFLDATYRKARVDHRVVCQAVVVAAGVAHAGLRAAIGAVFIGAAWQRCRVHYADLGIMPTWRLMPLVVPVVMLERSA
jgi:transposase-like protein